MNELLARLFTYWLLQQLNMLLLLLNKRKSERQFFNFVLLWYILVMQNESLQTRARKKNQIHFLNNTMRVNLNGRTIELKNKYMNK